MAADGSIIMHIHTHKHKLSYMKNTNSTFHPSYRLFVNGYSITKKQGVGGNNSIFFWGRRFNRTRFIAPLINELCKNFLLIHQFLARISWLLSLLQACMPVCASFFIIIIFFFLIKWWVEWQLSLDLVLFLVFRAIESFCPSKHPRSWGYLSKLYFFN